MHPHFTHSHHQLPHPPTPHPTPVADAFQRVWLVGDTRREVAGDGRASEPAPVAADGVGGGKGGVVVEVLDEEERDLHRRMSIITAYIDTPRKQFLTLPSPPDPASSPLSSPPSSPLPSSSPLSSPSPSPSPPTPFLVTAARFWCTSPADLTRLASYLSTTSRYSDAILLAVNMEKDRCSTIEWLEASEWAAKVRLLPVLPYFSTTSAMNALLITAFHMHATYILYQSTYITAQPHHITRLLTHFTPSTLVVASCLPSHDSVCATAAPSSPIPLTPESCPSNAFAVWHVDTTVMVGWGVTEEGGMISLVQKAGGLRREAKLVERGVKGLDVQGYEGAPLVERDPKRLDGRKKKFGEMQHMGWDTGTVSVVFEVEQTAGEGGGGADKSSPIHIGH